MPIPKHFSIWRKLKAYLTWATADQAFDRKPLRRYQKVFRWLFRVG